MNKKIRISDLCSELEEELYEELEITNMTELRPSKTKIEKLVSEGIKKQEKPKKRSFKALKIFLAAAVICLFATTAFAAAGGFQYFRSIFGDSTEHVQSAITIPMVSVENASLRLSLEGMLTDGYTMDLILSLEDKSGKGLPAVCFDDKHLLFDVSMDAQPGEPEEDYSLSVTHTLLPEYETKERAVYHLAASSLENCYGANLNLSFQSEDGSLDLTVPVDGSIASRRYTVNYSEDGNYTLETVQISPLGVQLIGREEQASGGLPTPAVSVKFIDGSVEEMMSEESFDSGDGDTIIGGGSAIYSSDPLSGPLVTSTYGMRNPGGKVVTKGEFSRFINLEEVAAVLVNGKEYTTLDTVDK